MPPREIHFPAEQGGVNKARAATISRMGQPDFRWINLIVRAAETFGMDDEDLARGPAPGDGPTPGRIESWLLSCLDAAPDEQLPVRLAPPERDVNDAIDAFILGALQAEPGLDPQMVESTTKLTKLIPRDDRHDRWRELSATLGWTLPDLQPDVAWWIWTPIILLLAPYIVGWGLLARQCDQIGGVKGAVFGLTVLLLGFVGMGLVVAIPIAIAKRFAGRLPVTFPEHVARVCELRHTITPERRREFADALRTPLTGTVWEIVQRIVSEEYERPLESVTRDSPLR